MNKKLLVWVGVIIMVITTLTMGGQSADSDSPRINLQEKTVEKGLNYDQECTMLDSGIKKCAVEFGVKNVFEDGQWKSIEEARSLKGNSNIVCNIDYDKQHQIICNDYNYTHVNVDLSVKDNFDVDIPLRKYRIERVGTYEEGRKDVKIYDKSFEQLLRWQKPKEGEDVSSINLVLPLSPGEVLEFGENSTELRLTEANTEVLDDSYVKQDYPNNNFGNSTVMAFVSNYWWYGFIKFNISKIPAGATIDGANLTLHVQWEECTAVCDQLNVQHVYTNYSWQEENITHNNAPAAGSRYNTTIEDTADVNKNTAGDVNLSVANAVKAAHGNGDLNVSFRLGHSSGAYFELDPKEDATVAYRPKLTVYYTESGDQTPPSFTTAPYNKTTTNQSVEISWTTDENTNYTLTIGQCPSFTGVNLFSNATLAITHDKWIDNLQNSTKYCVNVTAADSSNNKANANKSFTTAANILIPDTTPPIISSLRNTSTTNQSSFIEWSCNENCNYTISWFNNSARTSQYLVGTKSNNTLTSSHNPYLTGLKNSTVYYINLTVSDAAGNKASNNTFSFTTAANIAQQFASEQEGDDAILLGINTSEIWPATVYDSYQVGGSNLSQQFKGRFDKFAIKGNKRWAINYVSQGESAITGIFNITPTLYVLQLQDLSISAINQQVGSFINSTYP